MPGNATNDRPSRPRTFAFPAPGPLDAARTLERHRLWGEDPANPLVGGALFRVARLDGRCVPFRLTVSGAPAGPRVTVRFAGADDPTVRGALRQAARDLLGLDFDLPAFYRAVAPDAVLGPLVRRDGGLWGYRPGVTPDPFEMLVGAIAAQQVNLPFALVTRARLVRRFGERVTFDGVTVHAFPTPAAVAAAEPAVLRAMQFSTRKAEYIVGLARAIAGGALDLEALRRAPDEAVIETLTRLRGLGRWTAEWFLARGLGRPDVCPAGDLGVRRAAEALCFRGRPADPGRVRRRAQAWRPYRSLAVQYLLAGHRLRRAAEASQAEARRPLAVGA